MPRQRGTYRKRNLTLRENVPPAIQVVQFLVPSALQCQRHRESDVQRFDAERLQSRFEFLFLIAT